MQGAEKEIVECLQRGDLEAAPLDEKQRALLEYVKLLTIHSYRATAEDVQRLRDLGWNDQQIAETVYVTGMFAMFNRVADAFGLLDPGYQEMEASEAPKPASEFHKD